MNKPRKEGLRERSIGIGGQKCRCCKVNSDGLRREIRRLRRIVKQGVKKTASVNKFEED